MKYNINLNQPAMIEYGLSVTEFIHLDVLSVANLWAELVIIENEVYYWTARSKIAEELEAFGFKDDTIYRALKGLRDRGFIQYTKFGKKDITKLSKKGKEVFGFIRKVQEKGYVGKKSELEENTMSEKNPNYYVGKKSEFNSEKNPTYNNTNSYNNTTNNNTSKESSFEKKKESKFNFVEFVTLEAKKIDSKIDEEALVAYLKNKKGAKTKRAGQILLKAIRECLRLNGDVNGMIEKSYIGKYPSFYPPKTAKPQNSNQGHTQSSNDAQNSYKTSEQIVKEMYQDELNQQFVHDVEVVDDDLFGLGA